jgi:hypothetical protein
MSIGFALDDAATRASARQELRLLRLACRRLEAQTGTLNTAAGTDASPLRHSLRQAASATGIMSPNV